MFKRDIILYFVKINGLRFGLNGYKELFTNFSRRGASNLWFAGAKDAELLFERLSFYLQDLLLK